MLRIKFELRFLHLKQEWTMKPSYYLIVSDNRNYDCILQLSNLREKWRQMADDTSKVILIRLAVNKRKLTSRFHIGVN